MSTQLKYIQIADESSPTGTRQYATVYSRYSKMVEELFPSEKFSVVMEPVDASLLSTNPAAGTGAMKVQIVSLETGQIVRNAFAMRITDPSFDLHGVSKLQTDALRSLLKVCCYADDYGLEDELMSAKESGVLVLQEQDSHEDEKIPVVVKSMPEPKKETKKETKASDKQDEKKDSVPIFRQPSRAQVNLVENLRKALGIQSDALRKCVDQTEIKLLIKALRTSSKLHHKGEDFSEIIAPFGVQDE